MTEGSDVGRHSVAESSADRPQARTDDFVRPAGVNGGFAPYAHVESYTAPPPTVSPAEAAVFGRPPGVDGFAPGGRLAPRHVQQAPIPRMFSDAFGSPGPTRDGFAPEPGTRLRPGGPAPVSPWWKPDAARDPWRDPSAPFWLGRGAIFSGGRAAQLDPDEDTETALEDALLDETADEDLEPDERVVRRVGFGLRTSLVLVLVGLLIGGVGGLVGWFLTDKVDNQLHRPDVRIAQVETPTSRPPGSVAGIAKRVGPAVVSIAVTTPDEFAIGSGVVIDSDGDVLTNNHVIAGAAAAGKDATIVVTFSNEATAVARIVGRDPASDLAVIKVPNSDLTVATLGRSSQLAVGDTVVAIGSPLGLQGTVTSGIVSALNRPVKVASEDGSSVAYLNAIQTDAAINPGNSGGALANSSGAVIGINSAAALGTVGPNGTGAITGIGYAIPIDYAKDIAQQLIRTGTVEHASLGAQGRTVVSATPGKQVGGYIVQISPNGPADKAGLRQGDVVVGADGQVIHSFDQLTVIVSQHRPGDRIDVTYYRKGASDKSTTTVTLGKG
ncbi:MAG: trypsin-like peptidase domain-containing protein [Jatrophihabitans sp.]